MTQPDSPSHEEVDFRPWMGLSPWQSNVGQYLKLQREEAGWDSIYLVITAVVLSLLSTLVTWPWVYMCSHFQTFFFIFVFILF